MTFGKYPNLGTLENFQKILFLSKFVLVIEFLFLTKLFFLTIFFQRIFFAFKTITLY